LYKAVFEAALNKVQAGRFPSRLLLPGQFLYRGIKKEHLKLVDDLVAESGVFECLKIRDVSKHGDHLGENRFSGGSPIPGRPINIGGCYFFLEEAAGLAEAMHYGKKENILPFSVGSRRVSIPHLLATKAVLKGVLIEPKHVADLSARHQSASGEVDDFLRQIGEFPGVREMLKGTSLNALLMSKDDYSVSRALGHAFMQSGYLSGVIAQTARQTERRGETGDNLCLFGRGGEVVSGVRIQSALIFFKKGSILDNGTREIEDVYEIPVGTLREWRPLT
jgi:hypothetical protein